MALQRCVNALTTNTFISALTLIWGHWRQPWFFFFFPLPGEDVFAWIRIDHRPKLGDNNPVGRAVLFVGFALQKLTPVGYLTCNSDTSFLKNTQNTWLLSALQDSSPFLKVKLWMSDRPSNQWLYSDLPTEKRPGPFLSRVPCSHDGMEPAGKTGHFVNSWGR